MTDEVPDEDSASLLWQHRADPPQRYTANLTRYRNRGGFVRPNALLRRSLAADPGTGQDLARFYFLCLVLDIIAKEDLAGDIAELGVYKGGTAVLLADIARTLNRTAYLLDTFEGFDQNDLAGIDAGTPAHFQDTSLEAVRAVVGEKNVCFIKGHFPASAAALPDSATFCLVHLDCDLYVPMRDALNYFYPRLVPGGFLIVHEYSSLCWNGPELAVDEFLVSKTESVVPLTDNSGSIVLRKAHAPDPRSHWLIQKRASILTIEWKAAGKGAFSDLLGDGWSSGEDWGVWGVGDVHVLPIYLATAGTTDFELEAHVQAVLIGARTAQEIDVVVRGQTRATWHFTSKQNRAVRVLRIPALFTATAHASVTEPAVVRVEFRPRSVASPKSLDPANGYERKLGLGLHSLRLRVV